MPEKSKGRICVFSSFPMFPDTSGNRIRLKVICADLKAAGFEVHFVLHPREDGGQFTAQQIAQHKAICDEVFLVPYLGGYPPPKGMHHVESDIWDPTVEPFARMLFANVQYDVVIVHYAPFARFLTFAPPGSLKVIDTHDKMGDRLRMLEEEGQAPSFYYMTPQEEGRLLGMADLLIAIKDEEADYYHEVSGGRPVITIGLNPESMWGGRKPKPKILKPRHLTAGFIGSVNVVNVKAMQAMFAALIEAEKDFPKLSQLFTLNVYGSICGELRQYELPACVSLKGFIDEALDFYDEVDIALVPTVRSTGLKIKAVEALQSRCIVMSTGDGFSGVDSPFAYHRFSDPAALVKDLVRLLTKPPLEKTRELIDRQSGTQRVYQLYSESINRNMNRLIEMFCKPTRRIDVDFEADPEGWLKTLVMLRASLPLMHEIYSLRLALPQAGSNVLDQRVNEIKNLFAALPNRSASFFSDDDVARSAPRVRIDSKGWIDLTGGSESVNAHNVFDSKLGITGFARGDDSGIHSWWPRDGFRNTYWGKNVAFVFMLDGWPANVVQQRIDLIEKLLLKSEVQISHEFVVTCDLHDLIVSKALKVVCLSDWMSRPVKGRFVALADFAQHPTSLARDSITYSMDRSFYFVCCNKTADRVRLTRGDGAAVFRESGVVAAVSAMMRMALAEENMYRLNTHVEKSFSINHQLPVEKLMKMA